MPDFKDFIHRMQEELKGGASPQQAIRTCVDEFDRLFKKEDALRRHYINIQLGKES